MTGTASSNEWGRGLLSAELSALLAVARAVAGSDRPGELATALRACPSVDGLCDVALSQGMLGHLAAQVMADPALSPDPGLVDKLRGLQRGLVLRNLRQTAYLLQMLDKLKEAGVQAMPVRGPVWAQALYGDIGLRSWVDLDLLVGREQVQTARDALLAWGLRDLGPFNKRTVAAGWGSTGQIALGKSDVGIVVDLHWKITVATSPRSLTAEPVLARGETIELLDRQVDSPGRTDMLLLTCLEGERDRWRSVIRLLDLAVQVRSMREEEWPAAIEAAREAGCARRLAVSVSHVCKVFALSEPRAIQAALARDRRGRALVRSLRPAGLSPSFGGFRKRMAETMWGALSEDSFGDSLRHLSARLFAPTAEDWASYELHPRLQRLYGLLRPGRLALKWLRHSLGGRSGSGKR